jgi:hypothetical protein
MRSSITKTRRNFSVYGRITEIQCFIREISYGFSRISLSVELSNAVYPQNLVTCAKPFARNHRERP